MKGLAVGSAGASVGRGQGCPVLDATNAAQHRLSPAAKQGHLCKEDLRWGKKYCTDDGRGKEVGSSHLNTKLKSGGG